MNITKEDFVEFFVDKFGEDTLDKFNQFLEKFGCTQFYDVVVHMYNDLGHAGVCDERNDPYDTLECDFSCTSLAEIGSCFISWDLSKEGRKYWESFRDAWLEEINEY